MLVVLKIIADENECYDKKLRVPSWVVIAVVIIIVVCFPDFFASFCYAVQML